MDNLRSGALSRESARRPFSGEDFQRCAAGGSSPQSKGGLFSRIAWAAGREERKFPPGDPARAAGSDCRALASSCDYLA